MFKQFLATLLILLSVQLNAKADSDSLEIKAAKSLFDKYIELGAKFDSSLSNLYSDTADIQNTRYYPNGQTKTMKMPAAAYKQMIAASMPIAKARNDQDSYSKTTYKQEGETVRIQSLRHSHLKNYDSWLVLVVGKEGKDWKILQELSQSRP